MMFNCGAGPVEQRVLVSHHIVTHFVDPCDGRHDAGGNIFPHGIRVDRCPPVSRVGDEFVPIPKPFSAAAHGIAVVTGRKCYGR